MTEQNTETELARAHRMNVMLGSALVFFAIVVGVWIVLAWPSFRRQYASPFAGWRIGGTYQVEITVVSGDRHNLACASGAVIQGLHCGYRRPGLAWKGTGSKTLRPYTTFTHDQLLGAGLWGELPEASKLPASRFLVVCRYRPLGLVRTPLIRWSLTGAFGPTNVSWAAGALTDCVIPK